MAKGREDTGPVINPEFIFETNSLPNVVFTDINKDVDTNIFETKTGALNLAPVKISGQYKIVITEDNSLYFDDYNNKRVLINKSQRFLPQLANFLRTKSTISDYSKLRYGGFSSSEQLSYHAPFYIGKNNLVPNYFIINNVGYGNKLDKNNLTDDTNLGNISYIRKIVNLKESGIHAIFNEILESNNYTYPFYSNFETHKIILYGFDYQKTTRVRKEVSLLNNASNQTYFGSLNNNILNLFNDNDIIFPRFINIEFEFSDKSVSQNLFGNYYGFYSYENVINQNEFEFKKQDNKLGVFAVESMNNNILSQKQTWDNSITKYKNLLFTTNGYDTQNKLPFARLKFNFLFDNDTIKIYDEYNNIYFVYLISQRDMKNTFRETLIEVARNITKDSENQIKCRLDTKLTNTLIFEMNSNITNLYFKKPEQLNQYEFIDLFNTDLNPKYNSSNILESTKLYFKAIGDNDIVINNIFDTQKIETIGGNFLKFGGNPIFFKIDEYFIYNGLLICRVYNDNFSIISLRNDNLLIQIYEEVDTKIFYHNPIPFLNYINDDIIIESNEQFNKVKYLEELDDKFSSPEFQQAFDSFKTFKINDNKQFIHDFESSDFLYNAYPDANKTQVLNMKFGSYGFTSFLTPNLFNFDLDFYENNSNVNYEQEDLDKIRYHWFLIKSECPEYLNEKEYHHSYRRYFTDKPLITSKLIDTGNHCETVFMGVKYTLPRKYSNFLFAVYLDFNTAPDDNVADDDSYDMNGYSFQVNKSERTIYLRINKYLDFIDLLRDGKMSVEPFVDLSFFYSVRQAYNTKSELVMTFKSGGLLIGDDTIPTIFNGEVTKDWKSMIRTPEGDKWLICLKRSTLVNTSPLTDLIPQNGDVIFYVYSKHKSIAYQSMSVKLTGIQYVGNDYVWCEDISVNFFDTKKLLINNYETLAEDEIFKFSSDPEVTSVDNSYISIDNSNIQTSQNDNTFLTVLIGSDNKVFKILNTLKSFSLVENYIEKRRDVKYLPDGTKIIEESIFSFPQFTGDIYEWETNNFDFDNTTYEQKITLFDRNQLWYLIKNVVSVELKFKHNTESQTIKIINELLLSNLYEFSNFNSIVIENSNEYVKLQVVANDFNVVIWNIKNVDNLLSNKLCKLCRYSGPNIPILDELKNISEFQVVKHNPNQLINIFDNNYGNLKIHNDNVLNINKKLGYNKFHINLLKDQSNSNDIVTQQLKFDINSIGLWDEIDGNIISSLFIKKDEIVTLIKNSNTNIYNSLNLFKTNITEEDNITVNQNLIEQFLYNGLFTDKNKSYISKFNYNLDEYIYNTGIEWLLNKFYYLVEIRDTDNRKISFTFDNKDKIVEIDINNYQPNGTYKLIWKRK